MKPRDTAALMLLALVWGAALLFIREVVREVPPVTVVAGRLLIAAGVLVPVAIVRSVGMPPRASWWALVFVALFNNVIPFVLITAAEEHITSSVAATLVGTMPLFTLIFTFALGTERAPADRVAGLVVGPRVHHLLHARAARLGDRGFDGDLLDPDCGNGARLARAR
jgi:drug/metabolite transporter (DMT)-like permease